MRVNIIHAFRPYPGTALRRGLGHSVALFLIVCFASASAHADDAASSDSPAPVRHDTLVFKDGNRATGKLVSNSGGIIVFQSDRFGELSVAANDVVIVPAETHPVPAATAASPSGTPKTAVAAADEQKNKDEAEKVSMWELFSPSQLTASVRRFFGPYHGRVAFATESMRNTTNRRNISAEARIRRTWNQDEFQINSRYTYSLTNDVTTTDLLNADGLWRHTFKNPKYFAIYRPSVEANHAYKDKNLVPADYILLQQEFGVGRTLLSTPAYQLRAGVSENIFTNWVMTTNNHLTQAVESGYIEAEAKLPWRMSLSDRSVYYYALASGKDGFENKVELDKKFTETLSIGVHYEARYNNPDVRSADYTLLRLVFGFDY